jgi:hypothetical protein
MKQYFFENFRDFVCFYENLQFYSLLFNFSYAVRKQGKFPQTFLLPASKQTRMRPRLPTFKSRRKRSACESCRRENTERSLFLRLVAIIKVPSSTEMVKLF